MFRAKMLFSVDHKMKRKEKPRRESPFEIGYGVPTEADLARLAPTMLDMGVPIHGLLDLTRKCAAYCRMLQKFRILLLPFFCVLL